MDFFGMALRFDHVEMRRLLIFWPAQNPGWLMMIRDSTTPFLLGIIICYNHPEIRESRTKPTRIQWNDRGVWNTAHLKDECHPIISTTVAGVFRNPRVL